MVIRHTVSKFRFPENLQLTQTDGGQNQETAYPIGYNLTRWIGMDNGLFYSLLSNLSHPACLAMPWVAHSWHVRYRIVLMAKSLEVNWLQEVETSPTPQCRNTQRSPTINSFPNPKFGFLRSSRFCCAFDYFVVGFSHCCRVPAQC